MANNNFLDGGIKSYGAAMKSHPLVKKLKDEGAGLLLVHSLLLTSNKKLFDRRNEQPYKAYRYDVYGTVRGLPEKDVFYLMHSSHELGAISAVLNYRQNGNRHLFSNDGSFDIAFSIENSGFAWMSGGKHTEEQVRALYSFLEGHVSIYVAGIENAHSYYANAIEKAMDGTAHLYSQISLERLVQPLPEITLRLKYSEQKLPDTLKTHVRLSPVGTALPESERSLIRETWEATRISAIAERLNLGVIFAYPLSPPGMLNTTEASKYNFYRNTLFLLSHALEGRSFLISTKPALEETKELLNPMPMLCTGERRLKISELERQVQDGAVYGKLTLVGNAASEKESRALLEFINRHDAIMVIGTASRAAQVAQELEKKLGGSLPRPIIVNSNFCIEDSVLPGEKTKIKN